MTKKPQRSLAQKTGTQGEIIAQSVIESSSSWICRTQTHDFGVDLEAELVMGNEVTGQLLKMQVKARKLVKRKDDVVTCRVKWPLIHYSNDCRIPIILVLVCIRSSTVWYTWLQDWFLKTGRSVLNENQSSKSVVISIPCDQTLALGLQHELQTIATWKTQTQLTLSLRDVLRTAHYFESHEVMEHFFQLLKESERLFDSSSIDYVIDDVLDLREGIRGTLEGSRLTLVLIALCRYVGDQFTLRQISRLVVRGDDYSRTGINALGFLFLFHFDHIVKLNLVDYFQRLGNHIIAYYCQLREIAGKTDLHGLLETARSQEINGYRFNGPEFFIDKWANRGDSAILDYIEPVDHD